MAAMSLLRANGARVTLLGSDNPDSQRGIYLDGVPFAILLANLVAPLLDSIRPKPFGVR